MYTNKKEILPAYISKHNSSCEKQISLSDDSKQRKRRIALSCSKKLVCIIERNNIEDKHPLYRGKDCMKKFCDSLREHAKNMTDFGKKKCYH